MAKIVVLDGYALNPGDNPWTELEQLGELTVFDRTSESELLERAGAAEIILTNKVSFPKPVLQQLPLLKYIAVTATGYNIIDVSAARKQGVIVSNVPAYGANSVAQFTIALLLELCHRVGDHSAQVHAGDWIKAPDFCFWRSPQVELSGKRLGLVGFGAIGSRVATIGHALGMEVWAESRRRLNPPSWPGFEWKTAAEIFSGCDVVSLHCPLTPDTAGMVNRQTLRSMKQSAFLINTARGGLIQELDLAAALKEHQLAGAALDVISSEPMPAGHPLLGIENCILTPHMAWGSIEARRRLMRTAVENVRTFLAGRPANVVS